MGSSRRTTTGEASIGDKGHPWVDPSSINKVVHLTFDYV